MLELDVSETMTEYMEKVVVLGRPSLDRHPYHFIGPRMPSKSMAVELVAREAIRLLRDTLQGGISSSESNRRCRWWRRCRTYPSDLLHNCGGPGAGSTHRWVAWGAPRPSPRTRSTKNSRGATCLRGPARPSFFLLFEASTWLVSKGQCTDSIAACWDYLERSWV
jgi:hypothetical protein